MQNLLDSLLGYCLFQFDVVKSLAIKIMYGNNDGEQIVIILLAYCCGTIPMVHGAISDTGHH